jgi:hypothetical protein
MGVNIIQNEQISNDGRVNDLDGLNKRELRGSKRKASKESRSPGLKKKDKFESAAGKLLGPASQSMKKSIKIYAQISDVIALEFCVHAGIFYLLNSNNDKVGGDGFFGFITVIAFMLTFFNGILMTIAGIYLVLKDRDSWDGQL